MYDARWGDDPRDANPRDHDDSRSPGRGGGGSDRQSNDEPSHARDDARWPERAHEALERPRDPHDVFTRHVDVPRGLEREYVTLRRPSRAEDPT